MINRDYLWKAAFREFMQDFVHFFFPYKYDEIDWTQGIEFLDKELQKLYPISEQKNRIADVLVRLQLKNGKSIWVLLHIEVQGYTDNTFGQRMHQMRYRIEDLFGINPVMFAIFTDDDPNFHPTDYEMETWGASCRTRFLTYKVMDVLPSTYFVKDSPVAIIMEVAYNATQSKKLSDEAKMDLHLPLIKKFLNKGYTRAQIKTFLSFIEGYIKFDNSKNHRNFGIKIDNMVKYETTEDIFKKVEADLRNHRRWLYKQELKEAQLEVQEERAKVQEAKKERVKAEEEKVKAEEEKVKAEEEKVKAEEEKAKAEEEKAKAEEEKAKAEEEKAKAEEEKEQIQKQSVLFMLSQGIVRGLISKVLNLTLEEIEDIEIKNKGKDPLNGYLNGHSKG